MFKCIAKSYNVFVSEFLLESYLHIMQPSRRALKNVSENSRNCQCTLEIDLNSKEIEFN